MLVNNDLLNAVRDTIAMADDSLDLVDIAHRLKERTGVEYDQSQLRSAVWILIGRGEVELTKDRRVVHLKGEHQ